jgi:2-polyprenyl-3-methyl-5-hydroxy-6-metoxy-1,4-benzoquinol methylase
MLKSKNIEDVKQFWNERPCNVRHSNKPEGSREYFDEVERKKLFVEPNILKFTKFETVAGLKVLEVGCGIGTAAVNFARNGADYTGFELSETSLALTKQRFDVYGVKGQFYSGNAETLDQHLPPNKYDLIYSWGVIHHSPEPKRIIQQISNYLAPNGTFKLMLYAKNSWKSFMIEAGFDQPEAQYGCPIAYTYTADEVHELLSPQFEVVSIEQDHIFPYQVEPYKQGQYVKQPWFENMPDQIFQTLEKNLGWHLMITAKLKD